MTHHSAIEPALPLPAKISAWALPWLCSTTMHMALVVSLAVVYGWTWTRGEVRQRSTLLSGTEVVFTVGSSTGDALAGAGGFDDAHTHGYYDDDAAPALDSAAQPHAAGGGGDGASLAALLNEKPAVDLAGVLPAPGEGLGPGLGSGSGAGSGAVVTGEPRGKRRVGRGYARTGVFGAVGEGHKFVYVFDRSGSMDGHGGAPLSAAKAELIASLQNLGQTHQFQIVFYNEQPRVFNPSGVLGRLVFGTEQNKYLAQKFVGSITADGATRHEEALMTALRMAPDVIFFLTDADEPRMTAQQLAHVAQANRGASINAIEFGYGAQADPDNFLVRLARQNGGQHVYVDVSQLPKARR